MRNMIKTRKKFSDYLLAVVLFAPFFMPADYLLPDLANKVLLVIKFVLAIIGIIIYYNKNKLSSILLLFILFLLSPVMAVSTNGEQLIGLFVRIVLFNVYIVIATQYLYRKKILSCLKIMIVPYCIGQCISMFIYYPYGMFTDVLNDHNYYLFAHDNISLFSILPSLVIMATADIMEVKRIKGSTFAVGVLCLLAYIHTASVTAIVVIAAILLGFLFYRNKIIKRMMCSVAPELTFLTILLSVLVINKIPELSSFFEQAFNKTATISGRTTLWNIATERILRRPIIGYGFETSELRMHVFGISHVHNILLQVLYNGGLIMLATLIAFYRKLMKFRKTEIAIIIRMYLLLYAIAAVFDFYLDQYISIMPIAILMIDTLNSKSEKNSKNEK